jgi:hypothetical protein
MRRWVGFGWEGVEKVESYGRPESLAGRKVSRKPRAHVLGSGGAIGELGLEQMEG